MRRLLAVALVLALAAARPAAAFNINGEVGVGITRSDAWGPGPPFGVTTPDWHLNLNLSGSPFRRGLFDWNLGIYYRGLRSFYAQSQRALDNLGGAANITLFSQGPLTLHLTAYHSWVEFAEKTGTIERTGATLTTQLGGGLTFRMKNFPVVTASLYWNDFQTRDIVGQFTAADAIRLNVGASQLIGSLSYVVGYNASWNVGTLLENQYDSHLVTTRIDAPIKGGAVLRVFGNYFVRLPRADGSTNPRFDDGNLGIGVIWRPSDRTAENAGYNFRHYLIAAPGHATIEEQGHTLSSQTTHRFSPVLNLSALVVAGYNERRRDAERVRSGSESVGLYLGWNKPVRPDLSVGGTVGGNVGALESDVANPNIAWGARAGLNVGWTRNTLHLLFGYAGGYASNVDVNTLETRPGWNLSQQLTLSLDGVLRQGLMGRSSLSLIGNRREDPLLGSFANMTATLSLGLSGRLHTTLLNVGVVEGATSPLGNPLISDGLFLPAAYNAHSVFGSINGVQTLDGGRLVITEMARVGLISTPGSPEAVEMGAILTATYRLGLFLFSLDDRISVGGLTSAGTTVGNVFMFRVSRSFSWTR